jgi:hypothetical protein
LTVSTDAAENGKTTFEVTYQGAKTKLTPEQLTATMLNKLKDIIGKNNVNVQTSNYVISVTIQLLSNHFIRCHHTTLNRNEKLLLMLARLLRFHLRD